MQRFDPQTDTMPLVLPDALLERQAQIRRERGTAAADRFAGVILSHMRTAANEAYMRRTVGAPWRLALRAVAWWAMLTAPILWLLSASLAPELFATFLAIGVCHCVGQGVAAYLDGGRTLGGSDA